MILVIDVGNTNITFGVYEGKKLVTTFRMMSKLPHTSDEYGMSIRQLLMFDGISKEQIEGTILASVVPNIMHSLVGGITRYLGTPPLIVGAGTKTGIRIITESPKEIGPDRIVDAVAAYEKYGGPVLVLDFGTATTYDYVTADGCFAAGITAPGIRISAKALWEDTARLPVVEIKKPKSILAQETISSMQGRPCLWPDRTDRIYRQCRKKGNRPAGYESSGYRRPGPYYCRRNGRHRYLRRRPYHGRPALYLRKEPQIASRIIGFRSSLQGQNSGASSLS